MTQMGRQWWPRLTTRARAVDTLYDGGRSTTTRSFSTSTSSSSLSSSSSSSSSSSCCGLSRLLRKLKRHSNKMLKRAEISTSRQSSFQCRYDPLSYALNFDTSHDNVSDEDYYKFCAFSSRFVATPKADHSQGLMASRTTASH
ncbi:unnamed protein product [Withania somnifera]